MPAPDPNSWNLETWSKGFYSVYSVNDEGKPYSALWLPATSHASNLAEAVRLNDNDDVLYSLANVFAWALSFAERFRLDLNESEAGKLLTGTRGANWTEWILHKFPKVCHVCGYPRCICSSMRDIAELRKGEKKDAYEKFKEGRDKRIDEAFHELFHDSSIPIESMPELFDIFLSIYGGTLWGVSLSDIAYHFLEEVGEVSKEITYLETICGRHSRESWSELVKKDLGKGLEWDKYSEVCTGISRELADVFSWTTALCGKIFQQAKPKPDWKPREALVKVYIGDIPGSKKRRSVSLGLDSYDFICRYCDKKECSQGCIQEQIRKRIKEGMDESNMRFKYEVDIPRAGITKT